MIYSVVSIRDAVHGEYQELNIELSEAAAIRSFSSAVLSSQAREQGLFFTNPKDFSLWKIAEYDSESGVITAVQPLRLAEAGEVHG